MFEGDVLTAVAQEQSVANRIAFYTVTITNQSGVAVGHFNGTVYRTDKPLAPNTTGSTTISTAPGI